VPFLHFPVGAGIVRRLFIKPLTYTALFVFVFILFFLSSWHFEPGAGCPLASHQNFLKPPHLINYQGLAFSPSGNPRKAHLPFAPEPLSKVATSAGLSQVFFLSDS